MITTLLHKTFSVALAILVLISTVYFTVDKHYCGENLMAVAVFSKAENCGDAVDDFVEEAHIEDHCCTNKTEIVKGQDGLKFRDFDDLADFQQLFISSYAYSFINLFEGLQQQVIPHKDYSPPNLVADIQVLDQVFVI
ncbi:HYC_CC_PP family protein [Lacinutrix undariae]